MTPLKQPRQSLTTVLAGSKLRFAKRTISVRRKPFTRRSFKRTGLPSGVVSTAVSEEPALECSPLIESLTCSRFLRLHIGFWA